MTARAPNLRRRRALAVLAVSGALAASSSFWLADTGTNALAITPPPGVAANGRIAAFVPVAATITRPNGNAQIQAGVAIGKVEVAAGFANTLKLDVAWTNPLDADQVLNNPNAQVHIGVYYPIHTGNCDSVHANSLSDTRATIVADGLCTAVDTAATGVIANGGKLILHETQVAGFLRVAASDTSTASCTASGSVWCRPSAVDGDKNVFYVAATIITPGGKPAGQQNDVNELDFFIHVSRIG